MIGIANAEGKSVKSHQFPAGFEKAELDEYLVRLIEARTIARIVSDDDCRRLWECIADGYQRALDILNLRH